jgi:hypothetical protein
MECRKEQNIKIANKYFFEVVADDIFENGSNKSKLHSRRIKSRLIRGMLATIKFKIFCLPVSYLKT